MNCLLLEDNYHFAQMLEEHFTQNGDRVFHTDSVSEAKRQVDVMNFDLLIVDLHLHSSRGESGSGLDLVNYVRYRRKLKTPIVVTTGLESVRDQFVHEYGVDLFFNKPLTIPLESFYQQVLDLVTASQN